MEGDGPYEEYEWCGQRRVRVSSLLRPQTHGKCFSYFLFSLFMYILCMPLQYFMYQRREQKPCHSRSLTRSRFLPAEHHREGGSDRSGDSEMGGAGGVLEGGEAGNGSRVEPMSVELEALKEKVRVLERDGAAPSKFICLVCQVRVSGSSFRVLCLVRSSGQACVQQLVRLVRMMAD